MSRPAELSRKSRFADAELGSLVIGGLIPIAGVLFFNWGPHAAMFIFCAETILISAVFGWLFNYPDRSTGKAIMLMVVLAPAGFLLLELLKRSYREAFMASKFPEIEKWTPEYFAHRPDLGDMIRVFTSAYWIPLVFVAAHGLLLCRREMKEARSEGTTIKRNNEILLKWMTYVWAPFLATAVLLASWKNLNRWSLVCLLLIKMAADIVFSLRDRKRCRPLR